MTNSWPLERPFEELTHGIGVKSWDLPVNGVPDPWDPKIYQEAGIKMQGRPGPAPESYMEAKSRNHMISHGKWSKDFFEKRIF